MKEYNSTESAKVSTVVFIGLSLSKIQVDYLCIRHKRYRAYKLQQANQYCLEDDKLEENLFSNYNVVSTCFIPFST